MLYKEYFELIKSKIHNIIESTLNINISNIKADLFEFFKNILSGFYIQIEYLFKKYRDETYLEKAQLEESIIQLAKNLGYNINRFTAPILSIKYNNIPTKIIKNGDILGKVKLNDINNTNNIELDIIYFDKERDIRKIEKGDIFNVIIGKFVTQKYEFNITNNLTDYYKIELPLYKITLEKDYIFSNDNNNYILYNLDTENNKYIKIDISKEPEDYVIFNKVVDWSNNYFTNTLFIYDQYNHYGIKPLSNKFKLDYIVTLGYYPIEKENIKLNEDFELINIEHYGTFGDNINKIKELAPYYLTSFRRLTTIYDYKYIGELHPLVNNIFPIKTENKTLKLEIEVDCNYYNYLQNYEEIYLKIYPKNNTFYDVITIRNREDYSNSITFENSEQFLKYITSKLNNIIKVNSYYYFDNELKKYKWIIEIDDEVDKIIYSIKYKNDTKEVYKELYIDNIPLYTKDYENYPNIYLHQSRDISTLLTKKIQKFEKAICCNINIYYVKYNTIREPKVFTQTEFNIYKEYLEDKKMIGTIINLIPAKPHYVNLDLDINLNKEITKEQLYKDIENILNNYNLQINKDVIIGDILAKIGKLDYINYINSKSEDIKINYFEYPIILTNINILNNNYLIENEENSYIEYEECLIKDIKKITNNENSNCVNNNSSNIYPGGM